jgi:hypothetical protein
VKPRYSGEPDDAARVASIMVDGDACHRIVTARAMDSNDPKDRFLAGDNSRLVSFPADANMIPVMKTVLETGRRVTVAQKPGWVSVLAPVSDSLGDIVAVVEVAGQRRFDPQGNIK